MRNADDTSGEADAAKPAAKRRTAVLIPCHNEEQTVGKVVADFRKTLPDADIFVFDNCSTDKTALVAREAGAAVIQSPHPGKGNVVRHMFDAIDAETYLMVDGDDTYPAFSAPDLLAEMERTGADMVVGVRMSAPSKRSFRPFHKFGNALVAFLVTRLFSERITDVMSGYRAFSREFVKTVPLMSPGFEIETEMTLQALSKKFAVREIPIRYGERPEGSHSKLNTFSDGFLVLKSLMIIFKNYKPMHFFFLLAVVCGLCSALAGIPPILDYASYGYVYHVPLAVLAAALGVIAALSFWVGVILDTIAQYQRETFELFRRLIGKQPWK